MHEQSDNEPQLWILRPIVEDSRWGYDCAFGFVVRAKDELSARLFASKKAGDEGHDSVYSKASKGRVWLDSTATTCEPLSVFGQFGVVMRNFCNG